MWLFHLLNVSHFVDLIDRHQKSARNPIICYFLFNRLRNILSLRLCHLLPSCTLFLKLSLKCALDVHLIHRNLIPHLSRSSQCNFTFKYDVHLIILFAVKLDLLASFNNLVCQNLAQVVQVVCVQIFLGLCHEVLKVGDLS